MTHFLGQNKVIVKMIFFLFYASFFLKNNKAMVASEQLEMFDDHQLSNNREEFVNCGGGYGENKLSTVVVSGKLLCHSHHKTNSINPYPVSGASLALFCGTSEKTKSSWAKGITNSYGEFLIDIPSHLHAIPNLEKICVVKVINLPKNIHYRHSFIGKHKGIELTSIGEGIRIYSTHNMHLMPKQSKLSRSHKTKGFVHRRKHT